MTQNEDELSLKDFYDYTAQRIEQESDLINNRISWMLTFQGFLFTSIGLVVGVATNQTVRPVFEIMVPTVGIVVGVLTLIGVYAAYLSINNIKEKWKKKLGGRDFPPAHGTPKASRLGRIPSYGIPITVVVAWLLFVLLTKGG